MDYILWMVLIASLSIALWVTILYMVGVADVQHWVDRMDEQAKQASMIEHSRGLAEVLDKRGVVISRTYVRGNRDRT